MRSESFRSSSIKQRARHLRAYGNSIIERGLLTAASIAPGLSKLLCGTDTPLQAVVKGHLALRRNRKYQTLQVAPAQRKLAAQFNQQGFFDLGLPLNGNLLDRIAASFGVQIMNERQCHLRYESSPDIHEEHGSVQVTEAPVVQRTLLDSLILIPEIREMLTDGIVQFIEACYGCHVRLASVTYWRNYHVPPKVSEVREVGYSHYWHNDGHPIDTVKLFVAMSDVSEQDGPLHVIPKPITQRIVSWRFNRKQTRHTDQFNRDAFRMTGPRGRTVLCNTTLCLHRAGIPAQGRSRDMLQFVFRAHRARDLDSVGGLASSNLT